MNRQDEIKEDAQAFHEKYPRVWTLFVRYTFDRIDRGCMNYSARGIFHRVRWDSPEGSNEPGEYKLNDHYSPFYARKFIDTYPQYADFFRIRGER